MIVVCMRTVGIGALREATAHDEAERGQVLQLQR